MTKNNPALYRELSQPFANLEAANAALEGFAKEFEELRKKHRIPDVVCIVEMNIADQDGEEYLQTASIQFGDPLRHPQLAAKFLGEAQTKINAYLGKLRLPK